MSFIWQYSEWQDYGIDRSSLCRIEDTQSATLYIASRDSHKNNTISGYVVKKVWKELETCKFES
jgi:hypothetical protein